MNKKTAPQKPVARVARRQRIAEQIVAGHKVADIARSEGISRTWASQEAHTPETQALISTMVDRRMSRMIDLLDKSLDAILDSLQANKTVVIDGIVAPAGVDHFARLTGVKRYIELAVAGRVIAKPDDKHKVHAPITMQAIEAAIAAARGGN